ncbi:MAG: response regulator transcription factor [Ruminococcus sp.]|nr:response regulator transcription factor [Ruminococcus sp.]
MLRIALCDDDKKFVKHFKSLITKVLKSKQTQSCINEYYTADVLLNHHNINPFDVIFLDIDMPGISGFDIAKELSENCFIVFVTSHNELVYESFMFRPLNFIKKDSDSYVLTKLDKIFEQLKEAMKQDEVAVFENKEKGRFSLYLRDIVYIEGNNHCINIYLKNESNAITVRYTMTDFEEKYKDFNFVRIHKKFIVNLKYVFNINLSKETLKIKHGNELPMSRKYKKQVDMSLTEYLRRTR